MGETPALTQNRAFAEPRQDREIWGRRLRGEIAALPRTEKLRQSQPPRSIRRQIVVVAEGLLDIYRCPSRRIWIGSASRYHAHRPVTFCTVIGDAIYCDARYTRTTGSLSNFFQCPPPQSLHRKWGLRHFAALLRRVGDFALQVTDLMIAAELTDRRFVQLKQNFTQLLDFRITGCETSSANLAQPCAPSPRPRTSARRLSSRTSSKMPRS